MFAPTFTSSSTLDFERLPEAAAYEVLSGMSPRDVAMTYLAHPRGSRTRKFALRALVRRGALVGSRAGPEHGVYDWPNVPPSLAERNDNEFDHVSFVSGALEPAKPLYLNEFLVLADARLISDHQINRVSDEAFYDTVINGRSRRVSSELHMWVCRTRDVQRNVGLIRVEWDKYAYGRMFVGYQLRMTVQPFELESSAEGLLATAHDSKHWFNHHYLTDRRSRTFVKVTPEHVESAVNGEELTPGVPEHDMVRYEPEDAMEAFLAFLCDYTLEFGGDFAHMHLVHDGDFARFWPDFTERRAAQ